jgi:hypothetical protein
MCNLRTSTFMPPQLQRVGRLTSWAEERTRAGVAFTGCRGRQRNASRQSSTRGLNPLTSRPCCPADIERLLGALNHLGDAGHTVIVIEHHFDVIKTADYVIDLGPEGGHARGEVVVTGTPERVTACKTSHTGRFLRARLQ